MNKDLAAYLNPENFQIDDRNLEDMICMQLSYLRF